MRNLLILLASLFTICSESAYSQEMSSKPGWQWGRFSNIQNSFDNLVNRTNFYNDIFSLEWYIDAIYIEDTAFAHPEGYPNFQDFNLALIKRNSKGEFIKAIDIYSPPNKMLYYADMELDQESNIYLYGTYEDTLFVNDTFLLPRYIPYYSDIFLIKLDENLDFIWAKTIASRSQDACSGLAISQDDFIYLTTYNMNGGYDTVHSYINFFDQDSTEILTGVISLLKVDPGGNIIWRSEIRKPKIGTGFMRNTLVGGDGNIYIEGNVQDCDLYIHGDTLEFPDDPDYANDSFIAKYNPDGACLNAFFYAVKDMIVLSNDIYVDDRSNYYIPAVITNSCVFGSDTLQLEENEKDYLIAKMDQDFSPIWYERIIYPNGGGEAPVLVYDKEGMAFAFHGTGHFSFMDSSYSYNAYGQVLTGIFDPDGALVDFQVTNSSLGTKVNNILFDNCGNLILEGELQGIDIFGEDTLDAGWGFERIMAKSNRIPLIPLDMPIDTTGCESLTLHAPGGFLYYQWNDEITGQDLFTVNNSGNVNLKAANEDGCWSESETIVTIYPGIEFSLGTDTTILLSDTLALSVPGAYGHYLWSTGDTVPALLIPATQLQIGDNLIWLEIENGPCSASDSIRVNVIDNSFIEEPDLTDLLIYPNPTSTSFWINSNSGVNPDCVTIYTCDGKEVLKNITANKPISVTSLKEGVYIIEICSQKYTVKRKLIILKK
jgi:hypothetical protein